MGYTEEEEYIEYIEQGRTPIRLLLGSLSESLSPSCALCDHTHLNFAPVSLRVEN